VTANRRRRKRSTMVALSCLVGAIVAAGVLTFVGVQTLADSKVGRLAEGNTETRPSQRQPYTPTALIGTVDDSNRLTSLIVAAIEPDGTGGTMVELAASADANSGNTGVLRPLNAIYTVEGAEALTSSVEAFTGLSFDVVQLIDQDGFAQLVSPLGDIPMVMPIDLYDVSSGQQWPAGEITMPGLEAGQAVTAVDPAIDDWLFEPARDAVWEAVAKRVGAGIGTAAPVASDADLVRPTTLDEFTNRLFAGSVQFRAIAVRPIDDARVADELPVELGVAFGVAAADAVSVHDRAELLMVLAAIAPGRMGAPLDAPSFRIVSGFTADELEPLGLTRSDVLKQAISRLLYARVNIVSVVDSPGSTVPQHSTFTLADGSTVDGVRQQYTGVFGAAIDIEVAQSLIEGIDIQLVLGRDFLEAMNTELPPEVASSGVDDSAGTTDANG
jgi:hypothetical protein